MLLSGKSQYSKFMNPIDGPSLPIPTHGLVHPKHELMMMTWKPTNVQDEDVLAAIKAGIDALPPGVKILLNSGLVSRIFAVLDGVDGLGEVVSTYGTEIRFW
jgi:hypothetical protein